jgi:hypothetical protein
MKNKALNDVLEWLDHEIKTLKDEIEKRYETVNTLDALSKEIRKSHDSEYKEKYENLISDLEKEKERLVKLHNHYKIMENENSTLKTEIRGWHEWFSANKDIFDKLFSNAPQMNFPEKMIGEDNISQNKTPEKRKRIIKKKKKDKSE